MIKQLLKCWPVMIVAVFGSCQIIHSIAAPVVSVNQIQFKNFSTRNFQQHSTLKSLIETGGGGVSSWNDLTDKPDVAIRRQQNTFSNMSVLGSLKMPAPNGRIEVYNVYAAGVTATELLADQKLYAANIATATGSPTIATSNLINHVKATTNPHQTNPIQVFGNPTGARYPKFTGNDVWQWERPLEACVNVFDGADSIVPGPRGEAGQIVSVMAETLVPGSNATVQNLGSFSLAELAFGIPRGDKGDKGDKGETGDTGVGTAAIFCNLSGGTRSITYSAEGDNPLPTPTEFALQMWQGATRVVAQAWSWWTGGDSNRVYGTSTASTFTPSIKPTFSHASSHNYVAVLGTYSTPSGKQYCRTGVGIAVGKIGATGVQGPAGTGGGGTAPGGALNAVQYKYSSAATKRIFRGFGRFSSTNADGTQGTLIL